MNIIIDAFIIIGSMIVVGISSCLFLIGVQGIIDEEIVITKRHSFKMIPTPVKNILEIAIFYFFVAIATLIITLKGPF